MKNFMGGFIYGIKSMWNGFVKLCKERPAVAAVWMAVVAAVVAGTGYDWYTHGFLHAICWYMVVTTVVHVGMTIAAVAIKGTQRVIANWVYRTMISDMAKEIVK